MSKIKAIFNVLNGKVPVIMYGALLLLILTGTTISVFVYDIPFIKITIGVGIGFIVLFGGVAVFILGALVISCIRIECEAWPNTWNRIKAILKGENECSH